MIIFLTLTVHQALNNNNNKNIWGVKIKLEWFEPQIGCPISFEAAAPWSTHFVFIQGQTGKLVGHCKSFLTTRQNSPRLYFSMTAIPQARAVTPFWSHCMPWASDHLVVDPCDISIGWMHTYTKTFNQTKRTQVTLLLLIVRENTVHFSLFVNLFSLLYYAKFIPVQYSLGHIWLYMRRQQSPQWQTGLPGLLQAVRGCGWPAAGQAGWRVLGGRAHWKAGVRSGLGGHHHLAQHQGGVMPGNETSTRPQVAAFVWSPAQTRKGINKLHLKVLLTRIAWFQI